MPKRFITTIAAAALVLAGVSAQPAAGGNKDLARFLAGAATLVIIGVALEQSHRSATAHRSPPKQVYHHTPKPKPKVATRAILPEYCLRQVRSHKGPQLIYGKRCLRQNYGSFGTLPQHCETTVRGPNGKRKGFRPRCLYRTGYRG